MPAAPHFFPRQYLSASDLRGKERVVTIDRVVDVDFENDGRKQTRPLVHFKEDGMKPLVLNLTNFRCIEAACGGETDDWPGKKITLYVDLVSFKGKVQEAVRIKHVIAAPPPASQSDGDIPF